VGQFWTPILAKGGSLLHADLHLDRFCQLYATWLPYRAYSLNLAIVILV